MTMMSNCGRDLPHTSGYEVSLALVSPGLPAGASVTATGEA